MVNLFDMFKENCIFTGMSVFYFETSGVLVRTNVSTVIITKPNIQTKP